MCPALTVAFTIAILYREEAALNPEMNVAAWYWVRGASLNLGRASLKVWVDVNVYGAVYELSNVLMLGVGRR